MHGLLRSSQQAGARTSAEILFRKFPIQQFVDHRLRVVVAAILVVEIVRMLPHVDGQQWFLPFGERHFGIAGAHHAELAAVGYQPRPSAAKLRDRSPV